MRIAILSSGRFHVLDLARELDALGHTVRFYSYVPRSRTRKFGLPDRCICSLLLYSAPILLLKKLPFGRLFVETMDRFLLNTLDHLSTRFIAPCDVFISMSGLSVASARAMRQKYGSRIWIERGSRHIFSQKEILSGLALSHKNTALVPGWYIERELASYKLADVIVVPSLHAEQSFLEQGIPKSKLFRNPYGVDLNMFPPTPAPSKDPPTIIYVGAWALQKGCDVLTEAWRKLRGARLLHVGPVLDAPLPTDPGFKHHDPVPQWRLKKFYEQAHVFALASRQEGLGLVMAQALACGLPVVCTDRTGGEDLKEFLYTPELITVVPVNNPIVLAEGLQKALEQAWFMTGMRDILGCAREKLSWRAYGERYNQALLQI